VGLATLAAGVISEPARPTRDGGCVASPIVATAADCSTGGAEEHEDHPDDENDDAQRPQKGDSQQEAEQQQDESDNDHAGVVPTEAASQSSGVIRIA
jgi:hypothetical protein